MKRWLKRLLWTCAAALACLLVAAAVVYWWWCKAPYEQIGAVVYGYRGESPLLLDVFRPPRQNGAGILVLVSGSWKSRPNSLHPFLFAPFLRRGYTVLAVSHLSQPDCLIGDIAQDMHRAVRFVRQQAATYQIDPHRIGVVGGSSGGHLALLLATQGGPGPPDAPDPADRQSSAVQCVACFYPPTDLLNLGRSTENPGDGGPPKSYKRGFGPRAETMAEWKDLGRELSPIYHITPNLPPVFIVHGDADTLVPLDQSERFVERARAVGCNLRLDVRPGKRHGWPTMVFDLLRFARWFDQHLNSDAH